MKIRMTKPPSPQPSRSYLIALEAVATVDDPADIPAFLARFIFEAVQ